MENALERLREIRDQQSAARARIPERDRLISRAAGDYTERQIAIAAGLTQARVHQILKSR